MSIPVSSSANAESKLIPAASSANATAINRNKTRSQTVQFDAVDRPPSSAGASSSFLPLSDASTMAMVPTRVVSFPSASRANSTLGTVQNKCRSVVQSPYHIGASGLTFSPAGATHIQFQSEFSILCQSKVVVETSNATYLVLQSISSLTDAISPLANKVTLVLTTKDPLKKAMVALDRGFDAFLGIPGEDVESFAAIRTRECQSTCARA